MAKKTMKMDSGHGMDMMGDMDWTSAIITVVLMALGLWFLAGGFWRQFNLTGQTFDWMVAVWYAVGIALVLYGKMWKARACCCGMCHM
jgi:ethanolamine transporter EutH